MPPLKGQSIGGLLDPTLTSLTLNQRRTMQNLVAQGIAPNVARNLAIALTKSAAVPVQKKSYHQAFSEAAKEILPEGLTSKLHVRARAIAGGHAKKARRMSQQEVVEAVKAEGMTPPKGVQSACKRGLELAGEYGGPGLTEGAKARARSMAQGNSVSSSQLSRMASFFARHGSYEKESSPPSPGYVSWLLWGGDAGRSWANSKKYSVEKAFNEADHPRAENGQFSDGGGATVAGRTTADAGLKSSYGTRPSASDKNAHQLLRDARESLKKGDAAANAGKLAEAAQHYNDAHQSAVNASHSAKSGSNAVTGKASRASKEAVAEYNSSKETAMMHRLASAKADAAGDKAKSFLHSLASGAHAGIGYAAKKVSQAKVADISLVKAARQLADHVTLRKGSFHFSATC